MENVNFYEWLELPVEECETDLSKLTALVEKKINEWNSSKSMDIQSRASVYAQNIREAVQNPAEWKKIYNDYKKSVDAKINNWMESAVEDNILPTDQVDVIAQKCKVTPDYVMACAKIRSINVGELLENSDIQEISGVSLADISPDKSTVTKLNTSQKFINELGYADLFEWINNQVEGAAASPKSSKEEIESACSQIYNTWHKKQPKDNATSVKKSNNEKIVSGFRKLLKEDPSPIATYQKYLIFLKIETVLKEVSAQLKTLGKETINDTVYNRTVDNIYSIIGNRDNARSILAYYCKEKGISTPKKMPNVKVCPFCHQSFEKKPGDSFAVCPVCNRSYLIKCPSCGNQKNLLEDSDCDGIDLQKYPYWEEQVKSANEYFKKLQFSSALSLLNDIESEWKNFDGVAALRSKCEYAQQDCGKQVKEVEELIECGQYNRAKALIKKISQNYPSILNRFPEVEEKISNAKKVLAESREQTNEDTKIAMLMQIAKEVTDDIEINAELQKYPVKEVKNLKISVDCNNGRAAISWESDNKSNSVNYVVVKKIGAKVSNKADGEIIAETEEFSISDTLNSSDVAYYGVYASRGTMDSPIAVSDEPAVYLETVKATLTGRDKGFSVMWLPDSSEIVASYSESKIISYGEGIPVKNITPAGFQVEGLENGRTYYVSVYRTANISGKKYYSPIKVETITPMESIDPPEITVSLGNNPGEYRLTHINPKRGFSLDLYYSTTVNASIIQNSAVAISNIQSNLFRLNYTLSGKNEYVVQVDESQKQLYVYPVIIRKDTAMVGEKLVLQFVSPIKIQNTVPSGTSESIFIEKWPEGVDLIYLCYNADQYPLDYKDCDGKVQIPKSEYDSKGLLQIPNIANQKYYITFFARKSGQTKPVPVGNLFLDHQRKVKIYYQFEMQKFFGKTLSIKIKCAETNYIPELSLVVATGSVPLSINSGTVVCIIPEQNNFRGEATIKVPGYSVKNNDYGKLFCEDKSYTLVASGPARLS